MTNKTLYEQIFHTTSIGLIATNEAGIVVGVSKQAEEILAMKAQDLTGHLIPDIFSFARSLVMQCLASGTPMYGHRVKCNSNNLLVDITLIKDQQNVKGAVCSFKKNVQPENIINQVETYKQLNKKLETIINSSSDGIWVIDQDGKVLMINEASEKVNRFSASDVIGKTVFELVQNGLVEEAVSPLVIQQNKKVSMLSYKKRTGKQLLVTGTPVFDEHGKLDLVVVNERDMTELIAMREDLRRSKMEVEKAKDELVEISMLELKDQRIVADSKEMLDVLKVASKLARLEVSNILVLGESGTGKGLLAKFIHQSSPRSNKPFIQINCAALPENLIEAELFGYDEGAFTGASEKGKAGLLELADKGTLFLDEIGELPYTVQAKLLKYLDDNEVMRLGGTTPRSIDCTIVAATNCDLKSLVKKRKFRKDLFFRLNPFTVTIPPLRERPDDAFGLVNYFISKYNKEYGLKRRISQTAIDTILPYHFPGNVRELRNIIKKAVVMSESESIDMVIIQSLTGEDPAISAANNETMCGMNLKAQLQIYEKSILKSALGKHRTTREIASFLGVNHSTIVRKLKSYGLSTTGAN